MVKQVIYPQTVLSRNREHARDPQTVKLSRKGKMLGAVRLVHSQTQRFACRAKNLSELFIQGHNAGPAVGHQDHVLGFLNGYFGLAQDFLCHHLALGGYDPSRIDDLEGLTLPFAATVKPVAGHARLIAYQGTPAPADPVEQRGFADVGTTNNGDARKPVHRKVGTAPGGDHLCYSFQEQVKRKKKYA